MTGQLPSFSAPVFTVKLLFVNISNFLMSTVHQRNPDIRRISTKQEQAHRPSGQTYGGQEGGERLGHLGPPLCSCPLSSPGRPGQKASLGVLLNLRVFIRHPGVFSAKHRTAPPPPPKKTGHSEAAEFHGASNPIC